MNFRLTIIVVFATLLTATFDNDAIAHHSRVNFDLQSTIELSGTVVKWQYRNPHVFLHMDVAGNNGAIARWIVELGSIVNLKQIDLHRDTLEAGDSVHVTANPEKDPRHNYAFFKSLRTNDGTEYRFADVFAYSRNAAAQHGDEGATDFTGLWDEVATPQATLITAGPPDYPVTARGREVLDRFNPADEPGNTCGEDGLPKIIRSFYVIEISRDSDAIYFEYEFYGVKRVIHLNTNAHPDNLTPSDYGHSIGRMDGDTLVVDTVGFKAATWGIGDGLDSSEEKHVVERYTLKNEGHELEVSYTVTDPEFLTEPFSRTHLKRYVPGYVMTAYEPCDPDTAILHLEIENQ